MNFPILKFSKFYFLFFILLFFFSLFSLFFFKIKPGIDFKGGSIIEIEFEQKPKIEEIEKILNELNVREVSIQFTEEKGLTIKSAVISNLTFEKVISKIEEKFSIKDKNFEIISPSLSRELYKKTIFLILASVLSLLIYIIVAFSKISGKISKWHYGIIIISVLIFDVLVVISFISILSKFFNLYFNIPLVVALLTIFGYGINDKIVVFDRIRENLEKRKKESLKDLINLSINQTLGRSFNTSLTTIFPLLAIYFSGEKSLHYFSLILILGILVSTLSSLFLAPLILLMSVSLKWKK